MDPLEAYLAKKTQAPAADDADPLAAYLTKKTTTEERPEWLDKKPKAAKQTGHSLDNLSGELAGAKSGFSWKDAFVSAARDTGQGVLNVGRDVGKGAVELGRLASPVSFEGEAKVPFKEMLDPRYRRQMERGVSDTVTAGLAGRAAGAIDPEFAAAEAEDTRQQPNARLAGGLAGMALPSPLKYAAGKAASLVPGAGIGAGAARGVAAYEAAAVPAAIAQAPEGQGMDAALEAATNPGGLLLGGGLGAAGAGVNKAARNLVDNARPRATKDLSKDIVSAEGPRARVTDQKRVAEVDERIFDMTQDLPELRKAFGGSAEKGLPAVRAAKRVEGERMNGPMDRVDQLTSDTGGVPKPAATELSGMTQRLNNKNWPTRPDSPEFGKTTAHNGAGGVRLGDIVDAFEADAVAASKKASGQSEAARFRAVKENFLKAYGEPGFDPNKPINADGLTAGKAIELLEKAKARGANVDSQIDQVRKMATGGVDMDKRIPTRMFREEVTDLHKNAESAMGGLEGTARHEALSKLYDTGKRVIDKHLDSSGLSSEELATLRQANDRYFLLSRAEAAMESRGWKEATKSHGLAHSVHGAVEGGSLAAAAVYGSMHPAAIPAMAATYGAVKVAPAIAKAVNWRLAKRAPGSADKVGTSAAPSSTSALVRAAEEKRKRQAAMAAALSGGMQQ